MNKNALELAAIAEELRSSLARMEKLQNRIDDREPTPLHGPFYLHGDGKSPTTTHFSFEAAWADAWQACALSGSVSVVDKTGRVLTTAHHRMHPLKAIVEERNDMKRRLRESEEARKAAELKVHALEAQLGSLLAQIGKVAA